MQVVSTRDLALGEGWVDSDAERCRVRFTFPINAATGADDSAEEILHIVSGTAIAYVGDESGRVQAGDLAVVPALVPHGLENIGEDTVRVVGFFTESEIESVFSEPVQPVDATVIQQHEITAAALAA